MGPTSLLYLGMFLPMVRESSPGRVANASPETGAVCQSRVKASTDRSSLWHSVCRSARNGARRLEGGAPVTVDSTLRLTAHDLRTAVTAASGRLQLTVRRIERGEVDLGQLVLDLRELDAAVRRVCDLATAIEAGAPMLVRSAGGDTTGAAR